MENWWDHPSLKPGCLSTRVILIQTGEQTLKAARICVSLSNVQSQAILFWFISSFYPGSFSIWLPLSEKRQNKQLAKGTPRLPLLLNAICKMYFTSLWIAAVLNNSIWKFVKRTADAEQQLGRCYIVQGLRSPASRVSGSGEHPRVIHGASAVRKFLSRILYKNRCWPKSYLCLQDRLLSNNLSRLKAWRR